MAQGESKVAGGSKFLGPVKTAYESHLSLLTEHLCEHFSERGGDDASMPEQAPNIKKFSKVMAVLGSKDHTAGTELSSREIEEAVKGWKAALDYGKRYIGTQVFFHGEKLSEQDESLEKMLKAAESATGYILKSTKSLSLEAALLGANDELKGIIHAGSGGLAQKISRGGGNSGVSI